MNPITDCSGFLCSISFYQPFFWFFGVFVLIATAKAATKRDDITGHGSRTIRIAQGYPMISLKLMKEAGRPTANGATAVKIINCALPIFQREIIQKVKFARESVLRMKTIPLKIIFAILFPTLFCGGLSFLLASAFSNFVSVVMIIAFERLFSAGWVFLVVLMLPFKNSFPVILVMAFSVKAMTFFAMTIKTIRSTFVTIKVLSGSWKLVVASATSFGIHWAVSHWSYIAKGGGQAVGLAVQTVHEAVLAHKPIIPQRCAI